MSQPESPQTHHGTRVDSSAPGTRAEADRLLSRLVAGERASMALVEKLAPPVSFEELFAFYRESGFLYPGKLAGLDDRRDVVERTWRQLLAADHSVFRFISRLGLAEGRPRLINTICAFAYAPGTWQAQHLVSLRRGEYTGTLALLMALSDWAHDAGVEFARFLFRPNNPGTNGLFGGIAQRLSTDLVSRSLVDYGLTDLRALELPDGRESPVAVRALEADEGGAAVAFYERVLDPVELDSLCLTQLGLGELDCAYRIHGLTRRRTGLVALEGSDVVGACIVNHSSDGMNFSFLERDRVPTRAARPASDDAPSDMAVAGAGGRGPGGTHARLRGVADAPRRPRSRRGGRPRPGRSQAILGTHRRNARWLRRHDGLLCRVLPNAPRRTRGDLAASPMSPYIMESEREAERLALKTDPGLVRTHLAWTGLGVGESFVDVGCGTGEVVVAACELNGGARGVGIDADEQRLAHARATTQRAGATAARFLAARIDGPGSSGLEDGAFDHAWSRFFLEYQPSPASAVDEMIRVVRPGGRVTLIDIEGNCTWHAGMDRALWRELDAIISDLATTGFDPDAGRKLTHYANGAGLVDIRHTVEHYHRVIGTPDPHTAAAWQRKIETIRDNYVDWLFPHKAHKRWVFDALFDFLMRHDTMTWSLVHLVQGTKPWRACRIRQIGRRRRPSD